MVLLIEGNEDKLLIFFSLGVFLEERWITFVDLVKYRKGIFEVLTPIFLL